MRLVVSPATSHELIARLRSFGIPDPEDSYRFLSRSASNPTELRAFLTRREKREPVQYILGEYDFHELRGIRCRAPVLIPRPETEELVDFVLACREKAEQRFVDVGTGSGVIALALLKARVGWTGVGIDVDERACELAKENARLVLSNGERWSCERVGVEEFMREPNSIDFVVSNPPYIPSHEVDGLQPEIINFESRVALDGGPGDGGMVSKAVMQKALEILKPKGCLFLELHHTHSHKVISDWAKNLKPFGEYSLKITKSKRDFMGIERFWMLTKI